MLLNQVAKFVSLLKRKRISFCVVGGVAVLLYGGRASTIDFDFYLMIADVEKFKSFLEKEKIPFRQQGSDQIKIKYNGLTIDALIADPWVGIPAIQRAKKIKLAKIQLAVASPEDLIIMKTLADRTIDRRDVQELREIFSGNLDDKYIERRLRAIRKEIQA